MVPRKALCTLCVQLCTALFRHNRHTNETTNGQQTVSKIAKSLDSPKKDYLIVRLTRARGTCRGSMMVMVVVMVVMMMEMFLLRASHPTLSAPRPTAALTKAMSKLAVNRAIYTDVQEDDHSKVRYSPFFYLLSISKDPFDDSLMYVKKQKSIINIQII